MRAETALTPDLATLPPETVRARSEVETALIGRILWRRRRWIAGLAAAAALAALAYCLLATPQYTATAQILVDPRDRQVVANDVNPSSIAADGGVTQVESQGSVLQSSGVLLRAIAATHLDLDPEFNGSGLFSAAGRLFGSLLKTPDPTEVSEEVKARTLASLRKHMTVKRADKVLVLDVGVRAKTPERAAEVVNAIADAYLADQADARADAGRDASKALAARLDALQASVRNAETAVADYRTSHNFVVSTGQLVSDQQINEVSAQLTNAQNRVASLKAQQDQLRRNPGDQGTPEAMASPTMARLRDRESGVVERLASASRQLGPRHPDLAALEQSLRDVRALIAAETHRLREAAEADYARALDDEKALAAKLDAMKTKSLDDGQADVRLRELQRQADAARVVYETFLTRAKETQEAASVDTTNARIITRALPPLERSWPPTLLLTFGAALLGASLGAGGGLAHEYLRPSVLTPQQARQLAGAALLGVIAAADLDEAPGARPRQSADAAARRALRMAAREDAENGVAIGGFIYLASPPSAALARAKLAARIAALGAAQGRETLLIDGGAERPGFVDLLSGDQPIAALAYREPDEPFSRLARGVGDPLAAPPRAGADGFRLRRLRRGYDLVVIDGGAMADDARLAALAAQADVAALAATLGSPQAELIAEVEAAQAAAVRFDAVALIDRGDV